MIQRIIQFITLLFFFAAIGFFVAYRAGYFDQNNNHLIPFDPNGSVLNSTRNIQQSIPLDSIKREPYLIPSSKSMVIPAHISEEQYKWTLYRQQFNTATNAALDSIDAALNRLEKERERFMMMSSKSGRVLKRDDWRKQLDPVKYAAWDSSRLMFDLISLENEQLGSTHINRDFEEATQVKLDSLWYMMQEYRRYKNPEDYPQIVAKPPTRWEQYRNRQDPATLYVLDSLYKRIRAIEVEEEKEADAYVPSPKSGPVWSRKDIKEMYNEDDFANWDAINVWNYLKQFENEAQGKKLWNDKFNKKTRDKLDRLWKLMQEYRIERDRANIED